MAAALSIASHCIKRLLRPPPGTLFGYVHAAIHIIDCRNSGTAFRLPAMHQCSSSDSLPKTTPRLLLPLQIDYPAACNAVEKVLVHESLMKSGAAAAVRAALQKAGVTVHAGDRIKKAMPDMPDAPSARIEYSSMDVTMEVVNNMQEAIDHIHK